MTNQTLTILTTHHYHKELCHWLEVHGFMPHTLLTADNTTQAVIPFSDPYLLPLCTLLQQLLMLENPIIKDAHLVKRHIINTIFIPLQNTMIQELRAFFEEQSTNPTIHLNGYLTFRLQKYQLLISGKLYGIMKRTLHP